MKNVLVTGGAGFIGSHTVDLLVAEGYRVRILDNLEKPTHLSGKPDYLNPDAEFIEGDIRDVEVFSHALDGMDAVIHLAATGGFTSNIASYFYVNSVGTANLLEILQQPRFNVSRIVVASSVGIYGEGRYNCPTCGVRDGNVRSLERLKAGLWEVDCPVCGSDMKPAATPEQKTPSPEKAYSMSKFDEERLVMAFGRDAGIDCCALRYFLTYGPRQSLTNPYTGVISIFASRILADCAPIIFEDGNQVRDFIGVADVARANLIALQNPKASGRVFNVGTGIPSRILDVATTTAELLGAPETQADLTGQFRPGEARHIYADNSEIAALGFAPDTDLRGGLSRYMEWVRELGPVKEYFSTAMQGLRETGVVRDSSHQAESRDPDSFIEARQQDRAESLTVVIPAFNEAGNLASLIEYVVSQVSGFLSDFEILIVNDGSDDDTGRIANQISENEPRVRVVHHPFNIGWGGGLKTGILHGKKTWICFIPSDHQFDAANLQQAYEARIDADVVSCYRLDRGDTAMRRVISKLYNRFMRSVYGVSIRDLNWVKMYRRSILDDFEIRSHGWAVDAELMVHVTSGGYRIKEIPVPHHPRTWGKPVGVSFRNVYKTARELAKVRINRD